MAVLNGDVLCDVPCQSPLVGLVKSTGMSFWLPPQWTVTTLVRPHAKARRHCRAVLSRAPATETSMDDAVQDVFLVVHRRLGEFDGRPEITTWLFGIVLRVARNYRRSMRRRNAHLYDVPLNKIDEAPSTETEGPLEIAARREGVALLHRILAEIDEVKRAMLILVELQEMTVRAAAEAQGINVNTAHTRLRAAWAAFNEAVVRHQ
jgi:RNA polymerase sigma-70 factor (ECF subfamily)